MIVLLRQSQIRGVGLKVLRETVWENKDEGSDLSIFIKLSISGDRGEAVIPVLLPTDIEALKAGKTFSTQSCVACAFLLCVCVCSLI